MRIFLCGAATISLLSTSIGAAAREADLLDFTAKPVVAPGAAPISAEGPRLEGLGANPFADGGSIVIGVNDALRAEFIQQGFIDAAGIGEPGVSGPEISSPGWLGSRGATNLAMPGIVRGFVAGSSIGSFARCDGARYVPTWWLSRQAESRRAYYYETMAAVACEYGIPTALLDAVIAQESGYKYWAISSAGAMGMMQIMPGTARLLGLAVPFDPVSNMRAGARYLRQQLDRFGRVDLALAAYNAGPERRSLKAGTIPAIPETINYVATVTRNWSRLGDRSVEVASTFDRGAIAAAVVRESGYRTVELSRYDGSKAPNPM